MPNLGKSVCCRGKKVWKDSVIHGWCTCCYWLEDVRPMTSSSPAIPLRPGPGCSPGIVLLLYFAAGNPVGKFHFPCGFNESRPIGNGNQLRGFETSREPRKRNVVWVWTGENYENPGPGAKYSGWYISCPDSDIRCPDWGTVAVAIAKQGKKKATRRSWQKSRKKSPDQEPDALLRVEKAIRLVQGRIPLFECQYRTGRQVPTPPGKLWPASDMPIAKTSVPAGPSAQTVGNTCASDIGEHQLRNPWRPSAMDGLFNTLLSNTKCMGKPAGGCHE